MRVIGITFALSGRIMLDMQVIEALYRKGKEPHDYLHIKHERASLVNVAVCGYVS
jgi:hypothetical protein